MADSKIDFSFENLHFSCEGDNDWVEKQLNNVLNRIPALLSVHKKGENIVEEVIEFSEEDVRVAGQSEPITSERTEKTSRVKRSKEPKVAKEKIVLKPENGTIPKSKSANKRDVDVDNIAVKRGRKARLGEQVIAKGKEKKRSKSNLVAEQVDSPISQFIVEKRAAANQVRKFLATAVFLAKSNHIAKLSTPMISKALKSYGIEKLQNASDCLNKNEKKGYCIKEGKEFIITENGYLSIG